MPTKPGRSGTPTRRERRRRSSTVLKRLFHVHTFRVMQETERWDGAPVVVSGCRCGALERVIYGPSYERTHA